MLTISIRTAMLVTDLNLTRRRAVYIEEYPERQVAASADIPECPD